MHKVLGINALKKDKCARLRAGLLQGELGGARGKKLTSRIQIQERYQDSIEVVCYNQKSKFPIILQSRIMTLKNEKLLQSLNSGAGNIRWPKTTSPLSKFKLNDAKNRRRRREALEAPKINQSPNVLSSRSVCRSVNH